MASLATPSCTTDAASVVGDPAGTLDAEAVGVSAEPDLAPVAVAEPVPASLPYEPGPPPTGLDASGECGAAVLAPPLVTGPPAPPLPPPTVDEGTTAGVWVDAPFPPEPDPDPEAEAEGEEGEVPPPRE